MNQKICPKLFAGQAFSFRAATKPAGTLRVGAKAKIISRLIGLPLQATPGALDGKGFTLRVDHGPGAVLPVEVKTKIGGLTRKYLGKVCGEPMRDFGLAKYGV